MKTVNIDNYIGGWFGITASWLRKQLPTDKNEEFKIVLNTPGGDVFEGFAIYQLLKEYSNVTVEIGALVASAGTYAILSAKKVIARKTSTMMIHKAWGVTRGNTDDLSKKAKMLSDIDNMIAEQYVAKTGGVQEDMLQAMKDETWFIGGNVIKEFGLADEIVGEADITTEEETLARNTIMSAIENYRNEAMNIAMGKAKPDGEAQSFNLFGSKEENLTIEQKKEPVENEQAKTVDTEAIVAQAVSDERARIMDLINVSGTQINAELTKAIGEGQTKSDYCVALVEANKVVPTNNTEEIGAISNAPEAKDTVPEEVSIEDELLNKAKEILATRKGAK